MHLPQVCPGCEMPLVEAASITFVERDGVVWAAHLWCYMRDGMRPARFETLMAFLCEPQGNDKIGPSLERPPAS